MSSKIYKSNYLISVKVNYVSKRGLISKYSGLSFKLKKNFKNMKFLLQASILRLNRLICWDSGLIGKKLLTGNADNS